ncbi:MAG: NIPSNAP family protein [Planctomycetaceae bacterium]|nr:NIPSNAP family protein [Planctomycetaceae bacterium]
MKRREFMTTACAAGLTAASLASVSAGQPTSEPTFFEICKWRVNGDAKVKKIVDFANASLGLQESGTSPFGLALADPKLNDADENALRELYAFIPYKSLADAANLDQKFLQNPDVMSKYAAFREGSSSKNPVYESMERSLYRSYKTWPKFEVPQRAEGRILQLRIYRSFDTDRLRAKIHMFEEGGAIELFHKCGINSVFYGEALFGTFMPNLAYMVWFESTEQMDDAWAQFINHPDWPKMRDDPYYADTVTEIINVVLRPCEGSQI